MCYSHPFLSSFLICWVDFFDFMVPNNSAMVRAFLTVMVMRSFGFIFSFSTISIGIVPQMELLQFLTVTIVSIVAFII